MNTLGAELSLDLFPIATWSGYDAHHGDRAEYPGLRPTGSWTLSPDGGLHGLAATGAGWSDRETAAPIDIADRHLVLAYGSNPDPTKLLNRRGFFGGDSVIALRAAVFGWAAGWCDARRGFDDSVVATLVGAPRRLEVHPVLALTPHQLEEMDRWEGHPTYYRRENLQGRVWLETGQWREDVEVYLGTPQRRRALVRDGGPVLCADVAHAEVDGLVQP